MCGQHPGEGTSLGKETGVGALTVTTERAASRRGACGRVWALRPSTEAPAPPHPRQVVASREPAFQEPPRRVWSAKGSSRGWCPCRAPATRTWRSAASSVSSGSSASRPPFSTGQYPDGGLGAPGAGGGAWKWTPGAGVTGLFPAQCCLESRASVCGRQPWSSPRPPTAQGDGAPHPLQEGRSLLPGSRGTQRH